VSLTAQQLHRGPPQHIIRAEQGRQRMWCR
jgi:hypothetical protein